MVAPVAMYFHNTNLKMKLRRGNDHPMMQLAMGLQQLATSHKPPILGNLIASFLLPFTKNTPPFWSVISKLICHTMCSRWCKSNWSTFSSFKLWMQILSVEKLRRKWRKCKGDEGWSLKTLRLGCLMPWNTHNPGVSHKESVPETVQGQC